MSSALHVMIMSTGLDGKQQFFSFGIKNHWLFNCNTACIKMNPSSVQGRTIFIYLSFHGGLIYVTSLEAWLKFVNLILQRTGIFL